MSFYVYIVASGRNGTIDGGSTDDLSRRIWEHKNKARDGFAKTCGCDQLVWFETFEDRENAFRRERLNGWPRSTALDDLGPGVRRDERRRIAIKPTLPTSDMVESGRSLPAFA